MENKDAYATWVEIDLSAIENNVRFIVQETGVQVMAVVKANGYGHGAVQAAQAALRGGATWLAVARIEEALELRQEGLKAPILLLGYTPPACMGEAILNDLSLTVWSAEQVQAAAIHANRANKPASLHLKVDTGMSRIGVQPEAARHLAEQIATSDGVTLEGIFTHFARADEADRATTDEQERLFIKALAELDSAGLRPPLVHCANSAASLTRPSAIFDLVRLGIAMYGLHPSRECPLPDSFRPALSWKTVLSQVKALPPGRGVSYGHEYTTRAEERIGTIPVGYADGLRRGAPNQALAAGVKVPVVGRVCMDQVMLQLDKVPEAKAGDEVVLIGEQGGERISAEEVAERWGTINYEVVCGIGRRVPRVYI